MSEMLLFIGIGALYFYLTSENRSKEEEFRKPIDIEDRWG
jgi:hypothetical protein